MDFLTIYTTAKELGFSVGQISGFILMFFVLKLNLLKVMSNHNERLEAVEVHVGFKEVKSKGGH